MQYYQHFATLALTSANHVYVTNNIWFAYRDGSFITKPTDVANHLNYFFIGKIRKLRDDMSATNTDTTHPSISDQIMTDKNCTLEFHQISVEEASINNDKPPGSDNLDGKLLRIIADDIATPICHIFNVCLLESVCPQVWREAKVIPLPKNSKAPFTGSNNRPISLLPTLSKVFEKIVFDQVMLFYSKQIGHWLSARLYGRTLNKYVTYTNDWWLAEWDLS